MGQQQDDEQHHHHSYHHHHHGHHHHHDGDQQGSNQSGNDQKQPRILVDASNVAFTNHNQENAKGSVENLLKMRDALEHLGYHPIFIADAALKYKVDQPDKLNHLEQTNQVLQAPAGTQADYFLLAMSKREDLPIVSNDFYSDRRDEFPEAMKRRVPFMMVDGKVVIDRERLPHDDPGAMTGRVAKRVGGGN